MQTFLYRHGSDPRQVMWESLYYLDRQRLGKQRVEASQLLDAIDNPDHGWRSHPACKMWMPYRMALVDYYNLSLQAWAKRGYVNDLLKPRPFDAAACKYPPFLTTGDLRPSHRVALMLKNERYYTRFCELTPTEQYWLSETKRWYIDGVREDKSTAAACKRTYHWPAADTEYV